MSDSRQCFRLAIHAVWGEKCAWCENPITFREMEVDHIIPKWLDGEELKCVLELHGLAADYDREATRNLLPSCDGCNGAKKGRRPPPKAPVIALLLDRGKELADPVERDAKGYAKKARFERALGVIMAAPDQADLDAQDLAAVRAASQVLASLVEPRPDSAPGKIHLHPALTLIWQPDRWSLLETLGPTVAVVSDGRSRGIVGTHPSFICSQCGSNGPWNGIICQTCGNREAPDM